MFEVSHHAITQYRARTGAEKSDIKIAESIRKFIENGRKVKLKKKYRVKQIMKHGFVRTDYFRFGGLIIVVAKNKVLTVHRGESGRWEG